MTAPVASCELARMREDFLSAADLYLAATRGNRKLAIAELLASDTTDLPAGLRPVMVALAKFQPSHVSGDNPLLRLAFSGKGAVVSIGGFTSTFRVSPSSDWAGTPAELWDSACAVLGWSVQDELIPAQS